MNSNGEKLVYGMGSPDPIAVADTSKGQEPWSRSYHVPSGLDVKVSVIYRGKKRRIPIAHKVNWRKTKKGIVGKIQTDLVHGDLSMDNILNQEVSLWLEYCDEYGNRGTCVLTEVVIKESSMLIDVDDIVMSRYFDFMAKSTTGFFFQGFNGNSEKTL